MIVVDTNILVYMLIPGPHAREVEHLYEQDRNWAVPILWRSEFRGVLADHLRRRLLSFDQVCSIQRYAEFVVRGSEHIVDSTEVLRLARDSRCTAYECEFVALAIQLDTKLVTSDRQILRAFPGIAIAFS